MAGNKSGGLAVGSGMTQSISSHIRAAIAGTVAGVLIVLFVWGVL